MLRVPYALGVNCGLAGGLVANLLPVDSAMFAYAAYAGYAIRSFQDGSYQYVAGSGQPTTAAASVCINHGIDTVPGGRTLQLSPGVAGSLGAPVMLWQVVRYYFATSQQVPGRRALYRALPAVNLTEEIIAPFADSAHFEFYVDGSEYAGYRPPPANLGSLTGIELVLDALSERPRSDGTHAVVRLRTAVFFKNRRS